MTVSNTCQSLPEEILFEIFKRMIPDDLTECQRVCKSWYSSAHITLLQHVVFHSKYDTLQFLKTLKNERNRIYSNAVKKISFCTLRSVFTPLETRHVMRLFTYFRNIQEIRFKKEMVCLEDLNDERLCKIIIENCPSLRTVSFREASHIQGVKPYYDFIHKLRELLKNITIQDDMTEYGGVYKYLEGFTHLQELDITGCDRINTSEGYLRLLDHHSDLRVIRGHLKDNGEENIHKQLLDIPNNEHHVMIDRLSKLQVLDLHVHGDIHSNWTHFITLYLNGLVELSVTNKGYSGNSYSITYKDLHDFLDFMISLRKSRFEMNSLNYMDLTEYLVLGWQKLFQPETQRVHRIFEIAVSGFYKELRSQLFQLDLISSKSSNHITRKMSIRALSRLHSLEALLNLIQSFIGGPDTFSYHFSKETYPSNKQDFWDGNVLVLEQALDALPTVTRVILSISFAYHDSRLTISKKYPQVTHLQLYLPKRIQTNKLLKDSVALFPNLTHLFYGIPKGLVLDEAFLIQLQKSDLKLLEVDATMIKAQAHLLHTGGVPMKKKSIKKSIGFFKMKVRMISTGIQYSYIVSIDTLDTTKIDDDEFDNLDLGNGYPSLEILTHSLQTLNIFFGGELHNGFLMDYCGCTQNFLEKRIESTIYFDQWI